MKKKVKYIGIAAVVLTLVVVCVSFRLWNIHKKNTMIRQQNYVASKMLEIGEYEKGRILSAQTEQMKPNEVSERLLVLAAGLQSDYEVGIIYADAYLAAGEDKILSSARAAYRKALDAMEESERSPALYLEQAEKVRQEIVPLLLQVQNSISIKKNDENILAVIDLMSGGGNASKKEQLQKNNSLISQKAQLDYAIKTRDYKKAYEKAEALYLESSTFENRAVLANLAAVQGTSPAEDERVAKRQEQQEELKEDLRELEEQLAQETRSSKITKLEQRIEKLQGRIEELQREINAIPGLKAINFMEAATSAAERKTVAYQLEMANLYYQTGQDEKARKLLKDIVTAERTGTEPVSLMLSDLLRVYTGNDGQTEYLSHLYTGNNNVEVLWNRIAQVLGFVGSGHLYGENSFYGFVMDILDGLYNGLIIRNIDATDYPTVRVTVNVSMELEQALTKRNFSLVELGKDLNNFEFLNIEELQDSQALSVVLVVDRSGSMSGTPMEDTRRAVTSFIKTIDGTISVGLVAFTDQAQLIEDVTENKKRVQQGIASLQAGGGTNIYSGLKLAEQTLDTRVGRRVVILLSDGEDGNAGMIDEVLDEMARKNIYVYTIGFGGADTEYLSYIARKCSGKFIQADSSSMLREIYSSIGEYMTNDYVIEFKAVTQPEKFTRTVKILTDINDAFAEQEYCVGVPYDSIEAEQDRVSLADYFEQVGGSVMKTK